MMKIIQKVVGEMKWSEAMLWSIAAFNSWNKISFVRGIEDGVRTAMRSCHGRGWQVDMNKRMEPEALYGKPGEAPRG